MVSHKDPSILGPILILIHINTFDTTEKQYQYIVENIHMAAKEALGGKEAEAKRNCY